MLEAADDVGGTWYWNRYPGARCDIPTIDYTYSFDPDLEREWTWSEKYATQPEILRYAQFVADKYDLRSGITFEARVDNARWDDTAQRWHLRTSNGESITTRFYVMATGCLSVPKEPDVPGTERFKGDVYVTGRWPHHKVDFTGKRVAVVDTDVQSPGIHVLFGFDENMQGKVLNDYLYGGCAIIEAALGKRPEHFAYPVGDPTSAGQREFRIAADLGFKTAVTTRPGVIFKEHANHLLALPRVSLNGEFQRSRYASVLVSGAATGLWNGFRKLNVA